MKLASTKIEIACPKCKTKNKVTLKQVADENSAKCKGCSASINLKDEGEKVKKTISDVNSAFQGLPKKIDIKIKI